MPHAADLPLTLNMPPAVVLSSKQLIVSSGARVLHGQLKSELFTIQLFFLFASLKMPQKFVS